MFTGIVQSIGKVLSVKTTNNLSRVVIEVEQAFAQKVELGASIAINGVCLTVVECFSASEKYSHISFDVIDQTLALTNLSLINQGSLVNFERSLKVGDEIGGHQVSGHIHCTAKLLNIAKDEQNTCLTFNLEQGSKFLSRFIFEQGFIGVNGVSLTLGNVDKEQFNVHLIPETLARTNLASLLVGERVNIEFDQQTMTIVKTIERLKLSLN
jgi:riboflavin synthase